MESETLITTIIYCVLFGSFSCCICYNIYKDVKHVKKLIHNDNEYQNI